MIELPTSLAAAAATSATDEAYTVPFRWNNSEGRRVLGSSFEAEA